MLTDKLKLQETSPDSRPLSLSIEFDPAYLAQGIRVRPAQFARMCRVTRQTVSQWVKRGLVQLYPDGTLDPAAAAKRLIAGTDPARLRARIFRDLAKSIDDWKGETKIAKDALGVAQARIKYLESCLVENELAEQKFSLALVDAIDRIASASPADRPALLEELRDSCIIAAGLDLGMIAPSAHQD